MPRPRVEVRGLKELSRDLKALGGTTLTKQLSAALKAVAKTSAAIASRNAPRRSGRLAASVKPGTSGTKAFIRNPLPYAGVQEYGGHVGRNRSALIRAQPFMRPAVDDRADEIRDQIATELDHALEQKGFNR